MFTTLISTLDLHANLNTNHWVIIDCRFFTLKGSESGLKDYNQSHIPNAHYFHLDRQLSGEIIKGQTGRHPLPKVEDFVRELTAVGIENDTQIVVYDQGHGGIAARFWWMMNWLGHKKIAVLDGGWAKWQAEKLPTDNKVPPAKEGYFIATVDNSLVTKVKKERITNDYDDIKLIVDSRTTPRYQGEHEPLDPIAGHIPNAINAPFLDNLKNGQFLSKEELKTRFEKILNGTNVENTVFYCGSGVTACNNILALKYAGFGMAKLYPGSWSHWIIDKNRPIIAESNKETE